MHHNQDITSYGTLSWYNFDTQQYDDHPSGWGQQMTEAEARPYLPNDPAVRGIFQCRIGLGDTPLEAMQKALEALDRACESREDRL